MAHVCHVLPLPQPAVPSLHPTSTVGMRRCPSAQGLLGDTQSLHAGSATSLPWWPGLHLGDGANAPSARHPRSLICSLSTPPYFTGIPHKGTEPSHCSGRVAEHAPLEAEPGPHLTPFGIGVRVHLQAPHTHPSQLWAAVHRTH